MIRWASVLAGAAAFLAAHFVELVAWQAWFAAEHVPWFLNSGPAVAFTAGLVLIAGAAVSTADLRESMVRGANVGVGAVVAIAVVLAVSVGGNLFPIAAAIGAVIVVSS